MRYPEPQPIRLVMAKRRITQAELAKALGVSQPLVSVYLRGQRRPPLAFMEAAAEFLGLPVELCFRVEYVLRAVGDFRT